jgi:ubiquinol-cytochrome c reductase cytochrome c subunit
LNSIAAHRRHPAAAYILLLLALVVVGATYAALAGPSHASVAIGSSTQVDQGNALFAEGCSSCHGLNAQGTNVAPSLIGVGAAAVDFQVGTGRMPLAHQGAQAIRKASMYTDAERAALAAYVASLAPGPEIPSGSMVDASNADLGRGGQLFRTNCAQCHNFAGRGGALTNGKWAPSLLAATPTQIYEAMITGPESMPKFGDGTMTIADKQDIIKYVKNLQSSPNQGGAALGRLGPVTEGLFLWTVGLGLLIAVAAWIGAKAR